MISRMSTSTLLVPIKYTKLYNHICLRKTVSKGNKRNGVTFSIMEEHYPSCHATAHDLYSIANFSTHTESTNIPRTKNHRLDMIKEKGLPILESIASEIQSKAKDRLLLEDQDKGPSVSQLREARRLHVLVEDAIAEYSSKNSSFCIRGEPITVIDVEISPDLREAIVHWSLPYGVMMSKEVSDTSIERLTNSMQQLLHSRGGSLQRIVHNRLRKYYRPPKLRYQPARGDMLREELSELTL